MSDTSDILPSGTEADLQEQRTPASGGRGALGDTAGGGTGGSEADRQEQAAPAHSEHAPEDSVIAGEGTGGSEADRLEQAADEPIDGDEAFPRGGTDDDPTE